MLRASKDINSHSKKKKPKNKTKTKTKKTVQDKLSERKQKLGTKDEFWIQHIKENEN